MTRSLKETPPAELPDPVLLSAAIKASGLTVRSYTRSVLLRNERTTWRWLDGTNPLPEAVRAHCREELKLLPRGEYVRAVRWAEKDAKARAKAVADADHFRVVDG